MNDKVVIAGHVKLKNTIKAKTNLHNTINGTPSWVVNTGGGGIVYPHYSGPYTVTPSASVQTLDTSDKVMNDDVTVNPIPSEYIVPTGTKTITQNGTHDVAQYESAVVDVQGGITPTGTKQIAIASNGTVTEDVTNYASAEITTNVPASAVDSGTKSITSNGTHDVVGYANASVNVPNSYSSSDEGKVVSNGALVAQTSDTVTANDTYDTTLISSLTVNVSGGSFDPSDWVSNAYSQQTAIISTNITRSYAFAGNPFKTVVWDYSRSSNLNSCTYIFTGSTAMQNLILKGFTGSLGSSSSNFCTNSTALKIFDAPMSGIHATQFSNCSALDTLILRKSDGLVSLANNGLNATKFKSGGTGGTIYIPKALYDHLGDGTSLDYKSATNWSTYDGYGTITWAKIEGSAYESTTWWQ